MISDIRRLPDEAFAATRDMTRDALRDVILDTLDGSKVADSQLLAAIIVADLMNNFCIHLLDIDETRDE